MSSRKDCGATSNAEAILTPSTKFEKHDRPISRAQAIAEKLIDAAQRCRGWNLHAPVPVRR